MEDDLEESGYVDMNTWKITLPKNAYRFRTVYRFMAIAPGIPLVALVFRETLSRGIPSIPGIVLACSVEIAIICICWVFYSGMIGKMKFEYLSRAYISNLLMNDAFREEESAKAKAAASVRHEANRKRNAEAREMYESRDWSTKAAAARALAAKFKVVPKTAERWILSWEKE